MKKQINSRNTAGQSSARNSFLFGRHILLKFLLFLVVFGGMWQGAIAVEPDTVWTRDLWQLGSTINQVQFTKDGHFVVVAIGNGVSVFDVKTGIQTIRLGLIKPGNDNECNSFAITDDEKKLITSHNDYSIIVWDLEKADTISVFKEISMFKIKMLDFNTIVGMGNLPVWVTDSTKVYLFDFQKGIVKQMIPPKIQSDVFSYLTLDLSREFNIIAVTGKSYRVHLLDLNSPQNDIVLGTHNSTINDLAFSSDGKYLASASSDGIVKVWDIVNKSLVKLFKFDESLSQPNARYVKFSPQSGFLISGGGEFNNLSTKLRRLPNCELVYNYKFGASYGLDISFDSSLIAIGSGNALILLNSHWSPVGIDDPKDNSVQILYPNPAGNQITIPFEQGIYPMSLKISDINGQIKLINNHIEPILTEIKIDINSFLPGIYFASIIYPQKTVSFKFEKIR